MRTNGIEGGVEAATRLPVGLMVAVGQAIDDPPERSGSENRHDDVRESKSQRAIRRQVPLNQGARDMLTRSDGGHNTGEDRICCGVAPARRGGLDQSAAPIARWPTGRP